MAIKRAPDDFYVEELLSESLRAGVLDKPPASPHALYRLEKTGLATPEAAGRIGRSLGLKPGAIAYAGLKDKHARSIQHVTLAAPEAPAQAEGDGWKLERLGWLDKPLTAEAIGANRFRIAVRGLTQESSADMDAAVELLRARDGSLRFINYFGDQRFGSARHGQGHLARFLVKGEFEQALRLAIAAPARKDRREQKDFKHLVAANWGNWRELQSRLRAKKFHPPEARAIERLAHSSKDFRAAFTALPYFFQQLCVYAYQSHLWNTIARTFVAGQSGEGDAVLEAESPYGTMLFPAAKSLPDEWLTLDLPLLARKTELKEPWKGAAEAVLEAEGITLDELRIPGVRRPFFGEAPRTLVAEAQAFSLSVPESEGKPPSRNAAQRYTRTVTFELPRGSYATVLLKALGQ